MPALTALYGIKPQDVDYMTRREINEYLAQYQDLLEQHRSIANL